MCNILLLRTGVMPLDKEEFWNMCYNNWHSFGMSIVIGGKMERVKVVPESGEIDPQEVWDAIEKYQAYPRLLHVRHTTAGVTDLANCHPFTVYSDSVIDVDFAHNGTMHDYVSKTKNEYGVAVKDDSGPSDTVNFINRFLKPMLNSYSSSEGFGNIGDKFFINLVDKFWPVSNRGILFDSKSRFVTFGTWKVMSGVTKTGDKVDIPSANDDYFATCKRGPEYSRREVAKAIAKAQESKSVVVTKTQSDIRSFNFGSIHSYMSLSEHPNAILKEIDWDDWDSISTLGYLTAQEIQGICEDKLVAAAVLDTVLPEFVKLHTTYEELNEFYEADLAAAEGKLERATKKITSLVKELKALKGQ